ncbi:MAG: 30S ribosomal protein S6 [Eubacteriales bacterium]|nr:30S ribosomal protein S6 [Eubacteriales bacterium]
MSKQYELIYVLNPQIGEEKIEAAKQRVEDLIAEHGEVVDIDVWGQKRLAYEIEDQTEGFYILVHFKSEADFPKELERVLKISDSVMRYLIVKLEE